jgi:DNA-binding CsgD family transcriptional regulator
MVAVARPIIVVDGPDDLFERAVGELARGGWHVSHGFASAPTGRREPKPGRQVRVGDVRTVADASAAMLAVLDGAGVVIRACAPPEVLDRLLGDLRHVGVVEHRRAPEAAMPVLDREARELLGLLAQGRTLGDAAAALGLSRRTADRRLADARAALGVERTVEAVAQARRRGWLGS